MKYIIIVISLLISCNIFAQEHGANDGIQLYQMSSAPDEDYMILTELYKGINGIQRYVTRFDAIKHQAKHDHFSDINGSSVTIGFDLPDAGTTADSTIRKQIMFTVGGIKMKYKGTRGYTIDNVGNKINYPFCRHGDIEIFYNPYIE